MITVDRQIKREMGDIEAGSSTVEGEEFMKNHKLQHVFVEQKGHTVGIVTEPDSIRKVDRADRVPSYLSVQDIMSNPVIGIDYRRPVSEASDLMEQQQLHHVAVLKDGLIVGIVSACDLLDLVLIDDD
jgi:signal-transduction protein with cAMP-binding, CBS, and nucleotidyltransferase domain